MADMDDSAPRHERRLGSDKWTGTADQLVQAGIVERRLLPGEPGNNKVRATYYQGGLIGKGGSGAPLDESFLCVERYGKKYFIVTKGVSAEERLRRETCNHLVKNQPNIDFRLTHHPRFSIGEEVLADAMRVTIVDIWYYNDSRDYGYKIAPNPDEVYEWFGEDYLTKYITKAAPVIALPSAPSKPVQQPRRRGRLPKGIASFWDAQYARRCRDRKLNELRVALRQKNRVINAHRDSLCETEIELNAIKKQMQELLK